MRIQSKSRSLRTWLVVGLLAGACTIFLGGPDLFAAPDESPQGRASVSKSTSGGSGGSQGRASVSRGSGGGSAGSGGGGRATATRPSGGGGGSRGTAIRSGSPPRGGHRGGHHHHFYPRYYHSPFFGFSYFRYPYYLGLSHYPYRHYGPVWYDYPAYDSLGGIDLNVKPKRAEVYLDGQRIGEVRRFDGYPSMLWLEEGTYDLVIYEEGYETLHETIKVFPGVVIDFDARMEEGVATRPEEIVPPPSRQPRPSESASAEAPPDSDDDRSDGRRNVDLSREPARLHLTVEPEDASVYLDGRFLGTGGELAELRSGLMLNAGVHQLSVVRPSYDSEELTVDVAAGEDVELAIRLEARNGR